MLDNYIFMDFINFLILTSYNENLSIYGKLHLLPQGNQKLVCCVKFIEIIFNLSFQGTQNNVLFQHILKKNIFFNDV